MLINKNEMNCQFHLKGFSDTLQLYIYILLQINLSDSIGLMWDYTTPPTPTWNFIYEADLDFNLPTSLPGFDQGNSKNKRGVVGYDDQRLQLFRQIEGLMEL